jgi:macrolide transport system ATP-binding/permease protein
MIELRNVCKSYKMGDNTVDVLRGISLSIAQGEMISIMGPSGSGKSTLMHILGLLDVPSSGSYTLNGQEIGKLSDDDLAVLRREEIGFIFQQFNLLPRMTMLANVGLPMLYTTGVRDLGRAKAILERVGLGQRITHKPNELSGGQQQRVAIARALMNNPKIILADEPTGNLDSSSTEEILSILRELNDQGITVIIVTHEEEIGQRAKRLIRIKDGKIQSDEILKPATKAQLTPSSKSTAPAISRGALSEMAEHFVQGFKALAANKVRTVLSMLGILIGVGAVVGMLALGRGAQKAIESQLASLGSNLLVLRPGGLRVGGVAVEAGTITRLTQDDVVALKEEIAGIKQASPAVQGRDQVTYLNKNWSTQVLGVGPAYASMHAATPPIGRFFTEEENKMRTRVAVVGATVVRQIFGDEDPIGESIKINKVSFQVIGILPERGATGFRDQDDLVVIPVLTAMHRLLGKDYYDFIDLEMAEGADMESAQKNATDLMITRHRIPPAQRQDAYDIRNMADIQAALSSSSTTMAYLLASIAAISLLVGGIGIMNIMLVSVTERTHEIGLRKAIGARKRDILFQFLAESVVISGVGGLLGIFLGWLITLVMSFIVGWTTSISVSSVLLAFIFSATIGIVFGIYPARKASLLNPIEALRYE